MQRSLLATDGSLTLLLSAFLAEAISITLVAQRQYETGVPHPLLETRAGETVLRRTALLSAAKSRRNLVYCDSEIAIGRLTSELRRCLLAEVEPIGLILRNARAETFRQLVSWGVREIDAAEAGDPFTDRETVYRTYVIFKDGKPTLAITEYFLSELFPPSILRKLPWTLFK